MPTHAVLLLKLIVCVREHTRTCVRVHLHLAHTVIWYDCVSDNNFGELVLAFSPAEARSVLFLLLECSPGELARALPADSPGLHPSSLRRRAGIINVCHQVWVCMSVLGINFTSAGQCCSHFYLLSCLPGPSPRPFLFWKPPPWVWG